MNHENPQPAFYAIIPASVRYCKDLEPNAKLFYGELTALANQYGYCWASNEYFAQLYDVTTRVVQYWLESLKKQGFIKVEVQKDGIKVSRRIWITPEIQKMFTKRNNFHDRHEKNFTEGTPSPYVYTNTKERDISSSFFDKLKEINPKIPAPNLDKWAQEIGRLIKDGNTPEDIEKVIEYVISTKEKSSDKGFCWANIIHSPSALRKHFAKLWGEMNVVKSQKNSPVVNKKFAQTIVDKYTRQDIVSGPDYLEFVNGQYANHIKFDDKDFESKCREELNKRKLSTEGL